MFAAWRWTSLAACQVPGAGGLPGAGWLAGDAVEAVEDVGDGDLEDQGGEALLVVVLGRLVPDLVGYRGRAVGQAGGGLGECEGGALGVGEVGGLAPGGDGGHALG